MLKSSVFCFFALAVSFVANAQPRHKATRSKPVSSVDKIWSDSNLKEFENEIEQWRRHYHIPGLSVGIVNEKKLAWKKGFGYADVENKAVPNEFTVYQIASISKTFGSILAMQQVEKGTLSLDDPIAKYKIDLGARWGSDHRIKIKHLLTHTAMGNSFNAFKPGYSFRYNGDWFGRLKTAIEKSSSKSYGELLMNSIIQPLGLKYTVPSTDDSISFNLTGYDKNAFLKKVAKPYDYYKGQLKPIKYSYSFGPAAGIMSNVNDLALYSNAIDEGKILKPETWQQVFTPFVTHNGKPIQYGLGWFITYYKGIKLEWHTGWWMGYSALFVKIPSRDLTFIVLANSQDLSRPFYHLGIVGFPSPFRRNLHKNLLASAFAKSFIHHFVDF